MTASPHDRNDSPDNNETPASTIDDGGWVHAVVSAALMQANIEGTQAERVLHAATSQPEELADAPGPFSTPAKPTAEGWPALEAERRAEETRLRLAAQRPATDSYFEDSPELVGFIEAAPAANPAVSPAQQNRSLNAPLLSPPTLAPVPSGADVGASDTITKEPTLRSIANQGTPHSTALPALDEAPNTFRDLNNDEVLEQSNASVEGYRQSDVRTIVEWLLVVFLALVVAVLAKEFVVQAFFIPSESMETTVNIDDRVLVNKLSYQFNDVRRGDLVVFSKVEGTQSDTEDLIKRAVALPGETIELRSDGRLWIWGPGETPGDALLLDEPYLDANNALLNAPSSTDAPSATMWHENCVNDGANSARCTLDDNSYFMMGDNRSRSLDSRGFGPVSEENLIGRAFFRIWPFGAISTL